MPRRKILVVIGQIGAGKSAVCRELEATGVRHLDVEHLRMANGRRLAASAIASHIASASRTRPVAFECTGAADDFEEILEHLRQRGLTALVALLVCSMRTALSRIRDRQGRVRPRAGGSWVAHAQWTESRLRFVPADLSLLSETEPPASLASTIRRAWEGAECAEKDESPSRGLREVSFSQLAAFQICPWSYRLKYMDDAPEALETEQMYLGSRLHETLAWLYSDAERSKTDLVAWFRKRVSETLPGGVSRVTSSRLVETGLSALLFHHDVFYRQDHARTLAVERTVRIPLNTGVTFVGRVDRVAVDPSGTVEVIDYKVTRSERTSRPRIPDWLQLAAYSIATMHELDLKSVISRRIILPAGEEERFVVAQKDVRRVTLALDRWTRGLVMESTFPMNAGAHCASCQFNPICTAGTEYPVSRRAFVQPVGYS